MNALLFGGTVEGRLLAQRMAENGYQVTCSVATEYGKDLITPQAGLTVRMGRLDEGEMEQLMEAGAFALVVDATHPYAAEVSKNIRRAAEKTALPYYRLLRPAEQAEGVIWVDSIVQAAEYLAQSGETALLSTGSKELEPFTQVPGYQERLWVRVLPSMVSLELALTAGFPASHIICMQGPFTEALNTAMLEQIGAKVLVSKDSGKAGGFGEKARAAQNAGAKLLVIRRPVEETGQTLEELTSLLCRRDGEG